MRKHRVSNIWRCKMDHIIAVPFDPDLAEFIGKRGSTNSITFYNRKVGEDIITAIMPSSITDKFYALAEVLLVAEQVVISTKKIDKIFGEVLIACSLLGKPVLFTDDNDISGIIGGANIGYKIVSKANLMESILAYKRDPNNDYVRIDIDKAFNVKGVGSVVLGIVTKGVVKTHDKLYHSSGAVAEVRSIQKQDVDMPEAGYMSRVGLALKNLESDDIEKGDLLCSKKIAKTSKFEIELNQSKYANEEIDVDKNYGVAVGFSYVISRVAEIGSGSIILEASKPLSMEIGDSVLLVRENIPRIFASGKVKNIW